MQRFSIDNFGHKAGEGQRARNYLRKDIALILDSDMMGHEVMSVCEPMRATEGRLVRVVTGTATYRINLEYYQLSAHDIIIISPDSIIEIISHTPDFAIEALVISSLAGIHQEEYARHLPNEVTHLSLATVDWNRQTQFIHLLSVLLDCENPPMDAISHLILSMVIDLKRTLKNAAPRQSVRKMSRGEQTFHQFLRLANEYGYRERNVTFYAERLLITPNHLSAIVRQQSNQTVIDWLTQRTLTEARILLRHSTLMMYEIAEHLNFPEATAFGRYFKKYMQQTPLEYREGDENLIH